jgi:hypothetical protein
MTQSDKRSLRPDRGCQPTCLANGRDGKAQPDFAKMLTADFGWAEQAAGRTATGLMNEFKR